MEEQDFHYVFKGSTTRKGTSCYRKSPKEGGHQGDAAFYRGGGRTKGDCVDPKYEGGSVHGGGLGASSCSEKETFKGFVNAEVTSRYYGTPIMGRRK